MRILRLFNEHHRSICVIDTCSERVLGFPVNCRQHVKATSDLLLPWKWSVPMVGKGTQRPTCRTSITSTIMSRVIAIAACGLILSACTSSWMPSFDWSSSSSSLTSFPMEVSIESDPPGADAKAANGPSCKTPCTLALQASGDFTVGVSLNGYVPQTVPVKFIPPENLPGMEGSSQPARLDPNPVFVQLEPAPAPHQPAAKKKRAAKKSTVNPVPTAEATAPAATATFSSPPSQQPAAAGTAPWPMPR